ncbi:MAG: M24 family metallopeptidase, partial [Planctomycetales bacterium]
MSEIGLSELAASARLDEQKLKHQRVREFLEDEQYDGLLLENRENFSWYTTGGSNLLGAAGETCASLFLTAKDAVAVIQEPHVDRMVEEQLQGLMLEVKRVPCNRDLTPYLERLRRGLRTASDGGTLGTAKEDVKLARLRIALTPLERDRYGEFGRLLSHAVEATARTFERGETEAEIAGQLAHRLIKRGITPLELHVAGDDRLGQFPRPVYTQRPVERRCWVVAVAEYYGLCAVTGRMISFGKPDKTFRTDCEDCSKAAAAGIYFAQPGVSGSELHEKMSRRYEKMDRKADVDRAPWGCVTG